MNPTSLAQVEYAHRATFCYAGLHDFLPCLQASLLKVSFVGWQGSARLALAGVEVVGVAQLELRGLSGDAVTGAVDQLKASLQLGAEPAPEALTALTAGKPTSAGVLAST